MDPDVLRLRLHRRHSLATHLEEDVFHLESLSSPFSLSSHVDGDALEEALDGYFEGDQGAGPANAGRAVHDERSR